MTVWVIPLVPGVPEGLFAPKAGLRVEGWLEGVRDLGGVLLPLLEVSPEVFGVAFLELGACNLTLAFG
jgi:hypothetical protein